jgi:hypothetical protein
VGGQILEVGILSDRSESAGVDKVILDSVVSISTSMITLHVLVTKCWMQASVPMGMPMPTKPSGQKDG